MRKHLKQLHINIIELQMVKFDKKRKTFEKIISNNFEILKEMLETNHYSATVLSRIESKIDGNLWCPILKKEISQ